MVAPGSDLLFPRSGFVVAMQARWARSKSADPVEWIVVSRFGPLGEHLALHRTGIATVCGDPPLHLSPRQTAIGTLAVTSERAAGAPSATFRLNHAPPGQVLLTGDFMPARGYVRVYGTKPNLAIQAAGRWLTPGRGSEFRLSGKRVAWLGEYFE
jgi:hypothetical protein